MSRFRAGSSGTRETFDWQRHKGWLYDYFIVRSTEDVSRYVFRTADRPVRLAARSGVWWLYEPDAGPRGPVAGGTPR